MTFNQEFQWAFGFGSNMNKANMETVKGLKVGKFSMNPQSTPHMGIYGWIQSPISPDPDQQYSTEFVSLPFSLSA